MKAGHKPMRVASSHDGVQPPVRAPSDYVMASILATLFCCWPIGIFAILKAMQCRDSIYRENWEQATSLSLSARRLVKWTIVTGAIFIMVIVGLYIGAMSWAINAAAAIPSQGYQQMFKPPH